MSKKCNDCERLNVERAAECKWCGGRLRPADVPKLGTVKRRAFVCLTVCIAILAGFYISLIASAKPLSSEQRSTLLRSLEHLETSGFTSEAFLLRRIATFRSTDNWLNSSVPKENAYAATNFPFEIVTLYPDYFTYPEDDIERAAILLHEAKHLEGKDEHDAYEFVWRNRAKIGWTREKYADSPVWQNVRRQTMELVPELFRCVEFEMSDCTETKLK